MNATFRGQYNVAYAWVKLFQNSSQEKEPMLNDIIRNRNIKYSLWYNRCHRKDLAHPQIYSGKQPWIDCSQPFLNDTLAALDIVFPSVV